MPAARAGRPTRTRSIESALQSPELRHHIINLRQGSSVQFAVLNDAIRIDDEE